MVLKKHTNCLRVYQRKMGNCKKKKRTLRFGLKMPSYQKTVNAVIVNVIQRFKKMSQKNRQDLEEIESAIMFAMYLSFLSPSGN